MADLIKLKAATTLKVQANLGEEVEDLEFEAGDELELLQEFDEFWLVKTEDGKLINLRKDQGDPS